MDARKSGAKKIGLTNRVRGYEILFAVTTWKGFC